MRFMALTTRDRVVPLIYLACTAITHILFYHISMSWSAIHCASHKWCVYATCIMVDHYFVVAFSANKKLGASWTLIPTWALWTHITFFLPTISMYHRQSALCIVLVKHKTFTKANFAYIKVQPILDTQPCIELETTKVLALHTPLTPKTLFLWH